jgi:hypothetical protein
LQAEEAHSVFVFAACERLFCHLQARKLNKQTSAIAAASRRPRLWCDRKSVSHPAAVAAAYRRARLLTGPTNESNGCRNNNNGG